MRDGKNIYEKGPGGGFVVLNYGILEYAFEESTVVKRKKTLIISRHNDGWENMLILKSAFLDEFYL